MHDDSPTARVQRMLFMRSMPAARSVASAAEQFAAVSRDVYFDAGSTVYTRGQASELLYFMVEGQAELTAPGQVPWGFGPRDAFGFLDAMLERPHDRTATAVTDVHALVIHFEDWLDILEDNFALGRAMLLFTAEGLLARTLQTAPDGGYGPARAVGGGEAEGLAGAGTGALHLVDRLVALRVSDLLWRASVQSLVSLAHHATLRHCRAGETLFATGEAGGRFHIVVAGTVALAHAESALHAEFGRGQLVGGLASLAPNRFGATAVTDASVLVLSHDDWFDLMEDHFDVARAAFRLVAAERERVMRHGTSSAGAGAGTRADGSPALELERAAEAQ